MITFAFQTSILGHGMENRLKEPGRVGTPGRRLLREVRMVSQTEKGECGDMFKRCCRQELPMTVIHTHMCGTCVIAWRDQARHGRRGWPPQSLSSLSPPLALSLGPERHLDLPPLTCGLLPQLFLLTLSIFLGLGQPRNPKGKRKGPGRPGTLAPGPHQMPLDLVSQAKPYARMEEYERNLGEMVAQLRNSSEPARRKCEVNLQLWLSNKRSLSPWGYR